MDENGQENNDRLIEAIYRIVGQVEKRFDDLRAADREAVRVAHLGLMSRLEGFPQLYATRIQMEQATTTLRKLENEALSRETYEENRQAMLQSIGLLDRDKLTQSVFDTFIDNYRLDQDRAATERRGTNEVLANATTAVRNQIMEERGDFLTQEVYDTRHQALTQQVDAIERWQYKLVGGLVFATFVAPLVTGMIVYFFTKGFP